MIIDNSVAAIGINLNDRTRLKICNKINKLRSTAKQIKTMDGRHFVQDATPCKISATILFFGLAPPILN